MPRGSAPAQRAARRVAAAERTSPASERVHAVPALPRGGEAPARCTCADPAGSPLGWSEARRGERARRRKGRRRVAHRRLGRGFEHRGRCLGFRCGRGVGLADRARGQARGLQRGAEGNRGCDRGYGRRGWRRRCRGGATRCYERARGTPCCPAPSARSEQCREGRGPANGAGKDSSKLTLEPAGPPARAPPATRAGHCARRPFARRAPSPRLAEAGTRASGSPGDRAEPGRAATAWTAREAGDRTAKAGHESAAPQAPLRAARPGRPSTPVFARAPEDHHRTERAKARDAAKALSPRAAGRAASRATRHPGLARSRSAAPASDRVQRPEAS